MAQHMFQVVSPNSTKEMQFLMTSAVSKLFNPFMVSIFSRTPFCCYELLQTSCHAQWPPVQ